MRRSLLHFLVLSAVICSYGLIQHASAVEMQQDDISTLLSVAEEMSPLLSNGPSAWTEVSLRGSCETPRLALGINACNSAGFVTSIDLSSLRNAGKLATGFSGLSALSSLLLQAKASGPLPSEYSALTSLRKLYISGSSITGGFPESWSLMTGLKDIYIEFSMSDTPVTSPPYWLGNLNSIQLFNLNWAGYAFPSSVASSATLAMVNLVNVRLSGGFPAALVNNARISYFNFQGSLDFGTGLAMPSDWSGMSNLTTLNLADFNFNGPLPTYYPPSLKYVTFKGLKSISGSIPQSLLDSKSLTTLNIDGLDNLIGNVEAPSKASLSVLSTLSITHCPKLNGSISPNIVATSSIMTLTLRDLGITGIIPEPVSELALAGNPYLACNLGIVEIQESPNVRGSFPMGFVERCPLLRELTLESLSLTGTLPESWQNVSSPLFFKLSVLGNPGLVGQIPEIKFRTQPSWLILANCGFTGTIPASILSTHYGSFMVSGNKLNLCANAAEVALTPFKQNSFEMVACIMQGQTPTECGCPDIWPTRCFPGRPMASFCPRVTTPTPRSFAAPSGGNTLTASSYSSITLFIISALLMSIVTL